MTQFIVITTIHPKSEGIQAFEKRDGWQLVLIGDKKSVDIPGSKKVTFLSLDEQFQLPFELSRRTPLNHYSRKNIGYLYALAKGAHVIFDTDDDNVPLNHWGALPFVCGRWLRDKKKFVNIYKHFTSEIIWPRGFPLDEIRNCGDGPLAICRGPEARIGVWQGLSDYEPDADAIFYLLLGKKIRFARKTAFYLEPGQFCPLNSQNSLWDRRVFPYLYLPATVSFRFTDILRGYIAQRLLWQDGLHVGVTRATTGHRRSVHDILKDFADEVPMFLHIKKIVEVIESVNLGSDRWDNLFRIYDGLAGAAFVAAEELKHLGLWQEAFLSIEREGAWSKRSS
jgi:hypothetical protein